MPRTSEAKDGHAQAPAGTGASAGGSPRDPALDEAIILATRDRLVRDGYSRMTMGDIAADAQVSRPTIYRRWATKLDLVVDALDYGFRKQRDMYVLDLDGMEPREALVEAVHRLDPRYFNPDAMVLMANFAGELNRTPELLEILREHAIEPRVSLVENVLAQLQDRGPYATTSTGTPSPRCASAVTSPPSTAAKTWTRSPPQSSPCCGPRSPSTHADTRRLETPFGSLPLWTRPQPSNPRAGLVL